MNFIFGAEIKDRQIILENPSAFWKFAKKFEKKRIQLIIRRYKTSRTIKQNKLYWLYLGFIGDELGCEPEELHSTFKAMFLIDHSKKLPIVRSTTKLTTIEFANYIEKIIRKSAELGILLPEPNKLDL